MGSGLGHGWPVQNAGFLASAVPQSRIWTCQEAACSYREHIVRSEMGVAMRGYGQFCPVAKGAEVFAERWTPLVLRELLCGSTHFSDLHRGVPLMSRSLLSLRLKQLEQI